MGKEVFVVGAGGHGKVAVATVKAAGRALGGVYDDDLAKKGGGILGVPILGPPPAVPWQSSASALLGIGDNAARQSRARTLGAPCWATIIHPTATVHPSAILGSGTLVCAHAVIQPDARIGEHSIVNTGAIVEHDCIIGAYTHLAPGSRLGGAVFVGEGTLVGIGASVIPGTRIGDWCVVGAGAVVIRDLESHQRVVGVPAASIVPR
jgi:sugar O-acyltransferase (sialic acid O-acetyltransferase NeuD family)